LRHVGYESSILGQPVEGASRKLGGHADATGRVADLSIRP
jgi:hypothetical protein